MAYNINKVLSVAKNEVGYLEKKSNSQLNSKTANAGKNNYTKYARDIDELNIMNSIKQGYSWCAVFFVWLIYKAYGRGALNKILYGLKYSAGCIETANYYKKAKQFYSSPEVGDQIFFKGSNGVICHTGLVYKVDNTYVYTIEGNTSSASGVVANGGCVAKKKYSKNYGCIVGYGRPNYGDQTKFNSTTTSQSATQSTIKDWQLSAIKDGYEFPKYGADGQWGSECESVAKVAICKMYSNEYKNKNLTKFVQSVIGVTVDGLFGANTRKAVITYQRENKLTDDGVVGYNTWRTMLGVSKG